MITSLDILYLKLAYSEARRSRDESTQNGAVVVLQGRETPSKIVGSGFNDIPEGVRDIAERRHRPLKYQFTEHAERAAIFDAARHGFKTDGATMYCPWLACADCGRSIICAGIVRVVRHKIPEHASRPDWLASIAIADQMFREAGVQIDEHEGMIGETIRFNGVAIHV